MLLVLSLIASFAVPVQATGLSWEKVDRAVSADLADRLVQNETEEPTHRDTDIVRVSIVLEEKPTIQAGYSTMAIAQNHKAMAYQERLQARQQVVAQNISSQVLGEGSGRRLEPDPGGQSHLRQRALWKTGGHCSGGRRQGRLPGAAVCSRRSRPV